MDILKSVEFSWLNLYQDLFERSNLQSDSRDMATFSRRLHGEGLQFATVTLPSLAKDVLQSFQTGRLVVTSRFHVLHGVPTFLKRIFTRIYNSEGELREQADPKYVHILLQLLQLCKKLSLGTMDPDHVAQATQDFINTQSKEAFGNFDGLPSHVQQSLLIARKALYDLFKNFDPFDIRPNHGSGQTACRTEQCFKWNSVLRFNEEVDRVYPYHDYFVFSYAETADMRQDTLFDLPTFEKVARVTFVEKDTTSVRLISMEPRELQYLQQGLKDKLYSWLESHPLTRGMVNFTDQTLNQEGARYGALHGVFATLDLKSASDLVSWRLVRWLFPPHIVEALEAVRSNCTELPSGQLLDLMAHAPMGSANCFPIEATVFFILAAAAINNHRGTSSVTERNRPVVLVYGDDIIVDTDVSSVVIDMLEACGLRVNRSKSFISGPFRESCGGDFYRERCVTTAKLRRLPGPSGHARESMIGYLNALLEHFGDLSDFRHTVSWIESQTGPLPRNLLVSSIRSETQSSNYVFFSRRYNRALQYEELQVRALRPSYDDLELDGWGEVRRSLIGGDWLLGRGRYTRRYESKYQKVWTPLV